MHGRLDNTAAGCRLVSTGKRKLVDKFAGGVTQLQADGAATRRGVAKAVGDAIDQHLRGARLVVIQPLQPVMACAGTAVIVTWPDLLHMDVDTLVLCFPVAVMHTDVTQPGPAAQRGFGNNTQPFRCGHAVAVLQYGATTVLDQLRHWRLHTLRKLLGNKRRGGGARPERLVCNYIQQELPITGRPEQYRGLQRPLQAPAGGGPIFAPGNDLGDHGVIKRCHLMPFRKTMVDADALAMGRSPATDRTAGGKKIFGSILGIQAHFQRMPVQRHIALGQG